MGRLDPQLLQLGLASEEQITGQENEEEDRRYYEDPEDRVWPLTLAEKLLLLFQHDYPAVKDVRIRSVWAAGELLEFGGNFNKFVQSRRLQKQEGIIFRHLLRLVLLWGEFAELTPPDMTSQAWRDQLEQLRNRIIESCQQVDPRSTEYTLEQAQK